MQNLVLNNDTRVEIKDKNYFNFEVVYPILQYDMSTFCFFFFPTRKVKARLKGFSFSRWMPHKQFPNLFNNLS